MLIEFKNVIKTYGVEGSKINALNGVSFNIAEGEFVVILGPSGAGKSTILNLLGGMDSLSGGEMFVGDKGIHAYSDNQLTEYRAKNIGFIFQFYNLIPNLTVFENIALVKEVSSSYTDAKEVLKEVGLYEHRNKFPSQLSGGEQQRVSIARALVKNPAVLLCDEPTGALDSVTGVMVLSLLQKLSKQGKTVIIVTHNAVLADAADKVIRVKNGNISEITVNPKPLKVEEVNW